MPSAPNSFMPPAPSSHLPGRLTSLGEIRDTLPALENVCNLVKRLKVQAFVVAIHQLFFTLPGLKSVGFIHDLNDGVIFGGFTGPEEFQQELEQMSMLVQELDLSSDICSMFDQQQTFERASLHDQLRSVYTGVLDRPEQQRRGGQWEPFWMSLPNIINYDDDEEERPEEDPDSDHFNDRGGHY